MNILIIGGSGSLGRALTSEFLKENSENKIYILSREENKQWQLKRDYEEYKDRLGFIIADICNLQLLTSSLIRINPTIIIHAAAMKHIDICEQNTRASVQTNILGTLTLFEAIDMANPSLLQCVVFISTDKACNPTNNYGMCKAVSETLYVNRAQQNNKVKYVVVRYGNVLNSRGSIIPLLHCQGTDMTVDYFTLTDVNMTRFIMTLKQSVALIKYAMIYADTGTIVVPRLKSMRIVDLMTIFSQYYDKPFRVEGIRQGEKIHETLISAEQAARTIFKDGYFHILNTAAPNILPELKLTYSSENYLITKEELEECLSLK